VPADATTLDQSERSATGQLFAAAIGPVNAAYYSRIFGRFDSTDRAWLSWNWAACLCTLDWMVFRKLWGAALAYAGAVVASVLLVFGVGRLVYRTSAEMEMGLLAGLVVLAFAIPGLVGNGLLYAASKKRMARALAAGWRARWRPTPPCPRPAACCCRSPAAANA